MLIIYWKIWHVPVYKYTCTYIGRILGRTVRSLSGAVRCLCGTVGSLGGAVGNLDGEVE